jgi:hypothetical protein
VGCIHEPGSGSGRRTNQPVNCSSEGTQPDSRRRFFIFLATPTLQLPLPPRLALGTQAGDCGGAQARALGNGGAVPDSAAPSRQSPCALAPFLCSPADSACAPPAPLSPPVERRRRPAPAAALRCLRPAGSGSQQALLPQGGRAALVALMPQTKCYPSA